MTNKQNQPVYLQVSRFYENQILRKELLSGMRLPSEREIALTFEITRMTARRAVDELVAAGLVERRGSRGCFVKADYAKADSSDTPPFDDIDPMTPIYEQIGNYFREQMASGSLQEGDRLPSEREIADKFGISRMTARRAIEELTEEGLVVRRGSKGSFVTGGKVNRNFKTQSGIDDMLRNSRYKDAYGEITSFERRRMPLWLSRKMNAQTGTPCYHIVRRRKSGKQILIAEDRYYNAELIRGLENCPVEEMANQKLWDVIDKESQVHIVRNRMTMEAIAFDDWICDLFESQEPVIGFCVNCIQEDAAGTIIGFSRIYYRGDIFQYDLVVDRED